jgi:hypothetical protein
MEAVTAKVAEVVHLLRTIAIPSWSSQAAAVQCQVVEAMQEVLALRVNVVMPHLLILESQVVCIAAHQVTALEQVVQMEDQEV